MYEIRRFDEPNEAYRGQVDDGLRGYNDVLSLHHRDSREPGNAIRALDFFVLDETERVRAGLVGELLWWWTGRGWLRVSSLWVDETLRGQDYGTRLLREAEAAAKTAGCTAAHLTTYSFQARPFYEKQGYRCVGALDDFPPGHSYYWMAKSPL